MLKKFKTSREWSRVLVAIPALGLISTAAFGQAEVTGQGRRHGLPGA